jgi:hypothetical protein
MANLRDIMLKSARQHNRSFPDGNKTRLTVFADIGSIKTKNGTFEVVECRAVTSGMLAPRGQSWLSFHDENGIYVSSIGTEPMIRPLWCDGSKIYFFGLQGPGEGENVLDFANGLDHPEWKRESAEGSWTPDK